MANSYCCITVTRHEGREPVVYGPYRNHSRAERAATRINDLLENEAPGCAASVVTIQPTSYADDPHDVLVDVA